MDPARQATTLARALEDPVRTVRIEAASRLAGELTRHLSGTQRTRYETVLAEYEGNGIGKRLLMHAVDWLRSIGFQQPWLAASPDPLTRAHGFYRALGWQPMGQFLENGDEILALTPDRAIPATCEEKGC